MPPRAWSMAKAQFKLLGNARVVRRLMIHRPEFLAAFEALAEMKTTAPPDAA